MDKENMALVGDIPRLGSCFFYFH